MEISPLYFTKHSLVLILLGNATNEEIEKIERSMKNKGYEKLISFMDYKTRKDPYQDFEELKKANMKAEIMRATGKNYYVLAPDLHLVPKWVKRLYTEMRVIDE